MLLRDLKTVEDMVMASGGVPSYLSKEVLRKNRAVPGIIEAVEALVGCLSSIQASPQLTKRSQVVTSTEDKSAVVEMDPAYYRQLIIMDGGLPS